MAGARSIPPHAVERPELLARLDVGRDAPLTLVVAPAGSGKSVLLTQWVSSISSMRVLRGSTSAPPTMTPSISHVG